MVEALISSLRTKWLRLMEEFMSFRLSFLRNTLKKYKLKVGQLDKEALDPIV
jgi:hypothetical protein